MEMFLVVTNNMYTSFTIWIGFVLIICDIPYREMVCTSICCVLPEGVGSGDRFVYIVAITVIYFAYIFLLLLLLIVPQVTFQTAWTTTFVKDDQCTVWLWNFQLFFIPGFGHAPDNGAAAVWQMHCSLPDDWRQLVF